MTLEVKVDIKLDAIDAMRAAKAITEATVENLRAVTYYNFTGEVQNGKEKIIVSYD